MTKRMNLAVLMDNEEILLWEYRILEKILSSGCADIRLFIINKKINAQVENNHFSAFYLLHEKFDRFIYKKEFDFDKKVSVLEQLAGTPEIKLINDELNGLLKNVETNNIHNYNLDLIINFGNTPIQTEVVNASKYGVLTYNIGNYRNYELTPACYWEVVNNMPEIEVKLSLLNKDQKGKIGIFRTGILPHSNSVNVSRNSAYDLASLLVPRIINGINENGNAFLEELIRDYNTNEAFSGYIGAKTPSSVKAFSKLFSLFKKFLAQKLWYHYTGYWFLIFQLNASKEFFPANPGSFRTLKAPKGKFWADPFVISKDHHLYIFVEEYMYKTGKGHISVLKLDEKGKLLTNERIIEKPYHMSYPHVFEYDESLYMVPESGANKTIELYKCTTFPNKWIFVRNIMEDIRAKDTTLFFYEGKWWMFTTIIEKTTTTMSFNELFLYYSDDLFSSKWQSHPKNPIISDHKLSRPAGKIFMSNNKIYRPSQDCSGIYGRALNINCITKLSETEYEEVLINKTEPDWDRKVKGVHTFNFDHNIMVMDVFSKRRRIASSH